MDALVMCGGRGTRLDAPVEKPLFAVDGDPMVDRVLAALADSGVGTVYAAVSPHAPETRAHLADRPVTRIETPGEGYVADLDSALERVDPPVLTVAADLPLLSGGAVDRVLDVHEAGSLTVCVPAGLKRLVSGSPDTAFEREGETLVPSGVNVVGEGTAGADHGDEAVHTTHDVRFAVNVNRRSDARVAEVLA